MGTRGKTGNPGAHLPQDNKKLQLKKNPQGEKTRFSNETGPCNFGEPSTSATGTKNNELKPGQSETRIKKKKKTPQEEVPKGDGLVPKLRPGEQRTERKKRNVVGLGGPKTK